MLSNDKFSLIFQRLRDGKYQSGSPISTFGALELFGKLDSVGKQLAAHCPGVGEKWESDKEEEKWEEPGKRFGGRAGREDGKMGDGQS